jgi:hypothetical protein
MKNVVIAGGKKVVSTAGHTIKAGEPAKEVPDNIAEIWIKAGVAKEVAKK